MLAQCSNIIEDVVVAKLNVQETPRQKISRQPWPEAAPIVYVADISNSFNCWLFFP